MEPGHEDREYSSPSATEPPRNTPQWSPVMKTGNTAVLSGRLFKAGGASMEPGHEDREYASSAGPLYAPPEGLNGARS